MLLIKKSQRKQEVIKELQLINPEQSITEGKKLIHFLDLLNLMELNIINLLITNRSEGKNTSLDEINKIIGIEKRPYKLRNNMRADVLKIINNKFKDYNNSNEELIERYRSTFDKRYFEYVLNSKYAFKFASKK